MNPTPMQLHHASTVRERQRARATRNRPSRLITAIAAMILTTVLHTEAQTPIPTTFALPSSAADTSQPGFVFRMHQTESSQPNENSRTEYQLAGLLGENIANPGAQGAAIAPADPPSPSTAPIRFDLPGTLNVSLYGAEWAGNFTPDDPIPGLPGMTGSNDNVAAEVLTWLELPAGTTAMGINSDDGFRMTVGGSSPIDQFAPVVGEFNAGRGASDTLFSITVAQAGLYAARCTWEQGGGGANIEMFTINPDGTRVLVNDTVHGGIRAYRAVTTPTRAYARKVSPAPNSTSAGTRAPIFVQLVDGATSILPETTTLSLDGATVPVTASKVGNVTTVSYTPTSYFVSGSHHNVVFTYQENGAAVNVPWGFTVVYELGPNGHTYEVVRVENGITWPDAKAAAASKGTGGTVSHLATITSYEEDLFLEALRQASKPDREDGQLWVGGFQKLDSEEWWEPYGAWMWLNDEGPIAWFNDGYPFYTYTHWHGGQPDNAYLNDGASEDYLAIGLWNSFGWNDDGYFAGGRRNGTLGGYIVEYEPIALLVDIKPGDANNPVNLVANGKLPVAVLSTAAFNANQLDVATIRFGRRGTEATATSSSLQDVNDDGLKDLLLHFNVQDTELIGDDPEALLRGLTMTHRPAGGRDRIQVIASPHYTLAATALQDVSKVTTFDLAVQSLTQAAITPTVGSQLQLKSVDIVGQTRWTKNFKDVPLQQQAPNLSVGQVQTSDALRHQPVKLKMLVPYSGARSSEQLYAETVVQLRPDLAVESFQLPTTGDIRQVINIPATIRELNGDLGATADVLLMEGDVVLDGAWGVSLPAHASMTVVFSAVFPETGAHALKVVVNNVNPGDYDGSNNESAASIDIIVPALESVDYGLSYNWYGFDYFNQYSNPYTVRTDSQKVKNEYMDEYLSIPVGLEFPLDSVTFQVRADGAATPKIDLTFIDIPVSSSYDYGCARQDYGFIDAGNGFYVELSSYSGACAGTGSAFARISHYATDYVVFSSYHDVVYGDSESQWVEKVGDFIDAKQRIDTTFKVSDGGQAFGGKASANLITSPYDESYDYFYDYGDGYFEHYEYHNRGAQIYGSSYGRTTP